MNEITVANVTVADNASANFIAGYSVVFLPGFYAHSGSYAHAWITETASFCDVARGSSIVSQPAVKSVELDVTKEKQRIDDEIQMKVYPNPNNGQFTIELTKVESGATVSIYNMLGSVVYQSTLTSIQITQKVNLSGIQKGIYIVKVIDPKGQLTKKMIVN
jgi:hypothetical protein